ncbi:hypothetical protein PENSUB_8178 [Penicillium subrubescens]|uniref:Uncharacterized protein n=1 Tax=Penicillium subrubescens TaxID=1316194 RepID=A0A1Q5TIB1_9EURO|nr:hypothetical protein PENSUB_8178 [Penicillium subrubescens]
MASNEPRNPEKPKRYCTECLACCVHSDPTSLGMSFLQPMERMDRPWQPAIADTMMGNGHRHKNIAETSSV